MHKLIRDVFFTIPKKDGRIYCLYLWSKETTRIIIYVYDCQKIINRSDVCFAISFQLILAVFIFLFWNH